MSQIDPNSVHRLAKMALDSGEAASIEEAMDLLRRYRLRLYMAAGWSVSVATQIAVATALMTASRAFLGGLELVGAANEAFTIPILRGFSPRTWAAATGCLNESTPGDDAPTLIFGSHSGVTSSSLALVVHSHGWVAQAIPADEVGDALPDTGNAAAATASAALAVNEAFLFVRTRSPVFGSRMLAINLWDLSQSGDRVWAAGPKLSILPKAVWLVGLGHLGQGFAWVLSQLPYATPGDVHFVLQDFDRVSASNWSTGLFVANADVGQYKTRLVASKLESAGFTSALVERRLNEPLQLGDGDPRLAFVGVDNVATRRSLSSAGFDAIVECGLGSGYKDFQAMRIHTFPAAREAHDIWKAKDTVVDKVELSETYKAMIAATGDECGVTQLASRAVGAPFVGAFAAALVVAEALRQLHGGPTYSTVDLNLKDFTNRTIVERAPTFVRNPGFVPAAA